MITIELTVLISIICTVGGFSINYLGHRHRQKNEDKKEAADTATVMLKLEIMSTTLTEIKADNRAWRDEQRIDHDKIIKLESSDKSQWARIEAIESKIEK